MKLKNYDNLFQNSYCKKSSINKKQAQNVAKVVIDKPVPITTPLPPPTTTPTPTIIYTECSSCQELCFFDFKKMVKRNKRNGKKHWCLYGDLPQPTKCSHCNIDLVFDRLYYDDVKGIFIPLSKDENGLVVAHRCLNKQRQRHLLT